MAWGTELIPYHHWGAMVSVSRAVTMAFSAGVFVLVVVHAVIDTQFLGNVIHCRHGPVVGSALSQARKA